MGVFNSAASTSIQVSAVARKVQIVVTEQAYIELGIAIVIGGPGYG